MKTAWIEGLLVRGLANGTSRFFGWDGFCQLFPLPASVQSLSLSYDACTGVWLPGTRQEERCVRKKQPKKLVLVKETVQRLDSSELARAAGAVYEPQKTTSIWWACTTSLGCSNTACE